MASQSHKVSIAENHQHQQLVEQVLDKVPDANAIDSAYAVQLQEQIKALLIEKNAVIIAHYYTDPLIQALAEETGGVVSDSLEMARFGNQHAAHTLVVAGVKFMGETAKILTPNKRVLMPTLEATC